MRQKTIKNEVIIDGIGLHSGLKTKIILKPNNDCNGIIFVRTDENNETFFAKYNNVVDTKLGTTISNDVNNKIKILTIEHLMSAIWACDIDNLIIEINNQEIPILDGSSAKFIEKIKEAGVIEQDKDRKFLKILKEVSVFEDDKYVKLLPSNNFNIDITVEFNYGNIGKQNFIFNGDKNNFISNISNARTFCSKNEIDYMRSIGLARGGSLDNAMVFDNDCIVNSDGLRYNNEVIRHKLLDCIGDLYTSGYNIIGDMVSYKGGHTLNNKILIELFNSNNNYSIL